MVFHKKLSRSIVAVLGLTSVITTSNLVHAKNIAEVESKPVLDSTSITVAQAYQKLNFNNNYYQTLSEADYFYRQGELNKAKEIQQRVKPDFDPTAIVPPAYDDTAKLNAKGQQYWQTANETIEADPETPEEITSQIFEPLQSLVKEYPGFIPGHILLADTHDLYGEEEEALAVIEKASEMYPSREDVLDTRIDLLLLYGQPLEASIAAREFAYNNPNNPKSKAYEQAANSYFKEYKKKLNTKITTSGILGTIGQVATGNELDAIQIGQMLLAGEKAAGQSFLSKYQGSI